jgi:hypothetical protein
MTPKTRIKDEPLHEADDRRPKALAEVFEKDCESQGQTGRLEKRDMGCVGERGLCLQVASCLGEFADSREVGISCEAF